MIKLNKLSLQEYNELIERLLGNFEGYSEAPYFDSKKPNRHVTIGRGFDIEADFKNFPFITSRKTFSLTGPEIETVYTSINRSKEDIISRIIAPKDKLVLSRERAVLVEMAYQGIIAERSTPLREAIVNNSDRAEAWFQIRYKGHMEKDDGPGQSSRHYREAEAFGLYYDPNNVSLDEAKQVYRMFQKHKDEIAGYEKLHGPGGSVTTKKWHRTGFEEANYGKKKVKTVGESFAPAKAALLAAVKEQYKDDPTLVAKLTDHINKFRPIDNYLNALKEAEKQPLKAKLEPGPVHAAKDHVQPSREPLQPENDFVSKLGRTYLDTIDIDEQSNKTQGQALDFLNSMISPKEAGASELQLEQTKGVKSNSQTLHNIWMQSPEQRTEYSIYPASELMKTASDALHVMYNRELEIRKFINDNYGRPMNEAEIEVSAVFSHLTKEEQGAVETAAKLSKERTELDKQTQQRNEIAEAYGYNRFYARIPNFLKNDHQKSYDRWGRELERKELELTKREEANRPEIEKALAKISAPEFQGKKVQTAKEIKASDVERINKLEAMGSEWGTFTDRRFCVNYLKDKLPERIGNMGIKVKGDPTDIDNLLKQSDHIAAQTKPVIEMTRQYERGIEWS